MCELPARLFLCARCQGQVLVCSQCDRGQRYCAAGCADVVRQTRQREAGSRYSKDSDASGLRSAHIGKFKPLADFEWDWPRRCDRQAMEELMALSFMADASNVMLVGPNGVGKSMLACNLGHQALIQGHAVLFITAA